jgi:ADP-ribosylglycohydrolase
VAVAVTAALATQLRRRDDALAPHDLLDQVLTWVPRTRVAVGIAKARGLDEDVAVETAVEELGNGGQQAAQDTVPFALWSAARHQTDFQAALWATAEGGGATATTCAIVGSVVAARRGAAAIGERWLAACEPLPDWVDHA